MIWETQEAALVRWAFKTAKPRRFTLLVLIGASVAQMLWAALPMHSAYTVDDRRHKQLVFALQERDSQYLAPYVPTPQEVVDRMLELAEVKAGDVVYDLGSGDGRIVITAARKYGVRAVGFEINPALVKVAQDSVRESGLEHLVEIREQDVRTVDFSAADVLTLYLYPGANLRLRGAIMRQMKPGSRVVSHNYGMGNWKAERIETLTDSTGLVRTIYLWRIQPRAEVVPPSTVASVYYDG
jgi:SAM-dependent methyltransferase